MTSNNHNPPGLYLNPPDRTYSLLKAQGIFSSVVADVLQDFPTQSEVQWTQPDPLNIDTTGLGELKGLEEYHTAAHYSPTPEHPEGHPHSLQPLAEEQGDTPRPTIPPVVLSVDTTMVFYNTSPYVPDTLQTPLPVDLNWEWENAIDSSTEPAMPVARLLNPLPDLAGKVASHMANFLEVVRFQALPANQLDETTENLEDMPDHNEALNQTLKDLKTQINDITQGYASYYLQAELFTSWFWATHSIMGAILRGCNSLNGVKDHILIAKGLYQPLTHLQLPQAMSEQMQRICETQEELDASHITNVYDMAVQHITSELTTLLAAHAYAALSDKDTCNHTIEQVVNKIHDSLYKGDPSLPAEQGCMGIKDWHDLWVHSMRDAMHTDQGGEALVLPITLTNSQVTKCFSPQICAEVKVKVGRIKESIITDATSHLISKWEAKFMDKVERRYNAEVESHAAEVFKHKEADIAKEVVCLEKQTREAMMEAANKVIHFQWKLVLNIVTKNKLKVVPANTTAPTVLVLDSQPNSQESILLYLDPEPVTKEITMLEPTLHKLMDRVDELAARKGNTGQTAAASLHNPANQMDAELSEPTLLQIPQPTAAPQDLLTAILAGITNLTTKIDGTTTNPTMPHPKQGPKGILINSMPRAPPLKVPPRPPQQQTETTAPAPTASAMTTIQTALGSKEGNKDTIQPAPDNTDGPRPMGLMQEEWNTLSSKEKKHKCNQANRNAARQEAAGAAQFDDLESFPPLPTADPNPFIVVTKQSVHNKQNMSSFAGAAHSAQTIPQPVVRDSRCRTTNLPTTTTNTTPTNLTTEVTIMRDGGLKDEAAEWAIRTSNPEHIVIKACSAMEQTAERPPFLLGG
ncbi:hypothetical protein V8E53_005459 [Lactarius tabidus]